MEIKKLFQDPKTNWKYLAIVVFFAIIAGGVILAYINGVNKEINSLKSVSEIKIPKEIKKEIKIPEKAIKIEGKEIREGKYITLKQLKNDLES